MKKCINILFLIVALISIYKNIYAENVSLTVNYDGKVIEYNQESVHINVDDKEFSDFSMPPVIIENYVYIPVRDVFEDMGAIVAWNPEYQSISMFFQGSILITKIDDTIAYLNDEPVKLDMSAKIINDKAMVPIRFISETLDLYVNWDDETRTVYISHKAAEIIKDEQDTVSQGTDAVVIKDESSADIIRQEHDPAYIDDFKSTDNVFNIILTSPITYVQKNIIDNKLVIDIINSELNNDTISTMSNPLFHDIRFSQFQNEPIKISRFVFEAKQSLRFSITLSDDRKSLNITFNYNETEDKAQETIQELDIEVVSDLKTDSLYIRLDKEITGEIKSDYNANELTLSIEGMEMNVTEQEYIDTSFVNKITTGTLSDKRGFIKIKLNSICTYDVILKDNTVTIKLYSVVISSESINLTAANVISIKKNNNYQELEEIDMYYDLRYIIILKADLDIVDTIYNIDNEYFNNMQITTMEDGRVKLIINSKDVYAYDISEDDQYLHIQALNPKQVYDKIIILDPGHGGNQPGASSEEGLLEKDMVLEISKKLIDLVDADDSVKIYSTRVTDKRVELKDRAEFANRLGDIFISIHLNSAYPNTSVTGTESYYYPHGNDSEISFSSLQFATLMQDNLVKHLGTIDRKVKTDKLVVLTSTTIPATLLEIDFLSNVETAHKLNSPDFQQEVAKSIYKGIQEVFSIYKPVR